MSEPSEARQGFPRAVLTGFALLIILLMLAIAAQVGASLLGINPLARFDGEVFILGSAITLNSLQDLQWHLLVIVALLPAWLVWRIDRHVRVDFLYSGLRPRTRHAVDLAGNLIFALPFLAMSIPAAWNFTMRAWRTDEGSANAGLNDIWLIKAALPAGLTLLALAVLWESVHLVRSLLRR